LCGFPHHALDPYLNKLIKRGYKVAICEQVEDPKETKGLVKREVTRIVTPGTNNSLQNLDEEKNNYLMSIFYLPEKIGISVCDITTGDYYVTEVNENKLMLDEILKFQPSEIICNDAFMVSGIDVEDLKNRNSIVIFTIEAWHFDENKCRSSLTKHFHTQTLAGLGIEDFPSGILAAGGLLQYLYQTQKTSLSQITHISPYLASTYMLLDSSTRRNLELVETMREKQKHGSLLWILDKTKTAMGARMLRTFIEQPLVSKEKIEDRLDAIEELSGQAVSRDEIREYLNPIYDLERLLGKVSYKSANPRDFVAFKKSLEMIPHIKTVLLDGFQKNKLLSLNEIIDPLDDICKLLDMAIKEEPSITLKEGNIIRDGFNEDIDNFRKANVEGKTWLTELENTERERTGIKNLKIKYNKVFGYYFDVTNSYKDLVPDDFDRKQTLANSERFTTPKLKELEDVILNASDKLFGLEYDMFCEIREAISLETERIQKTAKALAELDVIASLSYVAERNQYVRPKINEKGKLSIKDGRHPVVEKVIDHGLFISNDTVLDNDKKQISIITGPNMAGKSTYMRQVALIVLMAQIGSFVPAKEANVGLVDRIFTRVGASDDLASGQSTFMVEMNEVANILRNATKNSLLILDEIGRGTSTYDGLSIAWAVIEHISNSKLLGAKTLFATHYHELTELEGKINNVNNYCIAVNEKGDEIVFLRKIVKGGADKSYGIQVAKLAGVPDAVIERAKEIADELAENDITDTLENITNTKKISKKAPVKEMGSIELEQMSLFDTVKDEDIIQELVNVDVSNLTPMEALNTLYALQNKLKNRW
jgi:DNA mismatch repair protein MutS